MTARRGSFEFFQQMKKKPALQEVLDNFDDYTHEDIRALGGPVFPLWIKTHLLTMKNGPGVDNFSNENAENIANQMQENYTIIEDKKYEVRKYLGPTAFIGDPDKMTIEGEYGNVFQLLSHTEIFWGSSSVKMDPVSMRNICTQSESVGAMTVLEYKAFNSKLLKEKLNVQDYEPDPSGKITSGDFTNTADRYRGEIISSDKRDNIGMNGMQIINIGNRTVPIKITRH